MTPECHSLVTRRNPEAGIPSTKGLLILDPCPSLSYGLPTSLFFTLQVSLSFLAPHFPGTFALPGSFSKLLAQASPSMLSSSPASCTSPNLDTENPNKKVQWASGRRRLSSTDSELKEPSKVPRSRRPSRLTVKYDLGQLQRWMEMEKWVDTQVQELFQDQPTTCEIDLEVLMDLSTEEQKTQLEDILQNCTQPTESFISELLSQLKKLRRLSRPQK